MHLKLDGTWETGVDHEYRRGARQDALEKERGRTFHVGDQCSLDLSGDDEEYRKRFPLSSLHLDGPKNQTRDDVRNSLRSNP